MHGNSPALLPYALLDAIGRDETLLDPTTLFKAEAQVSEIDAEDAAYWNVEAEAVEDDAAVEAPDLFTTAAALGAVITPVSTVVEPRSMQAGALPNGTRAAVSAYLDSVHLIADEQTLATLRAELFVLLAGDADRVGAWLQANRVVFPGCEAEVADRLVALMQGEAEAVLALRVVEPQSTPASRKAKGEVIPFRRPEPAASLFDDAPAQQLALF